MVRFRVYMKPITQGSVSAYPVNGKVRIVHNHPKALYDERALIQALYQENGGTKYTGAVSLTLNFAFVRPKSVSAKKRPYMTVKPDLDKLVRAVLDALTRFAYDDDCQVTEMSVSKVYADEEYIEISVEAVD